MEAEESGAGGVGAAHEGEIRRILHRDRRGDEDSMGGEEGMNKEVREKIHNILHLCMKIKKENGVAVAFHYDPYFQKITVLPDENGQENAAGKDRYYIFGLYESKLDELMADECLKYLEFLQARQKRVAYQEQEKSPCGNTD